MTEQWTVEQYRAHFKTGSTKPHVPAKKKGNGDKAKNEMHLILKLMGIEFETEYRFHDVRRFKFDWAIPAKKIAIEYEGINSAKSRHTNIVGYSKDCVKYNLASGEGWTVLRYTALNYTNLTDDLRKLLNP